MAPSKSLRVKASLVHILSIPIFVSAQSIPGASLFSGNGTPGAGTYQLVDDYQPSIFFNKFNFYSSYDPTYGHVQYVNASVAVQNGLVSTTDFNTARIGVDTTNDWPRGGPGRPSVRVVSDNTYTHGLFVFDANHMPWGCGTWPAYWLLGPNWPYTGEIDIIEGVNTLEQDSTSLHSSPGCTIAGTGGLVPAQTTNCDTSVNGNSGCGSSIPNNTVPNNYGDGFNKAGGGVYVTEWTSAYVRTWFFSRGSIPASITSGQPDVSTFGTPVVNQQGSCNIDNHFTNMSIIINIDFCGAWAGQVYGQFTDCPQNPSASSLDSCVDFVGNNPSYFTDAYWDINSIRVYQMPAGAQPSSSYTTSLSSIVPSGTTNSINLGMGQASTSRSSTPYTGPISSTVASASAAPTPAICPTYNNTEWIDANGQGYTIGCGSDYDGAGTDLPENGVFSATSFEDCMEMCDATAGCIAVSFVGGNGAGTCYAKSTTGAFTFSGAVNAAVKVGALVSISVSSLPPPSTTSLATSTSSGSLSTASNSPICPNAAGSTYTDSQATSYEIICYTDYTGNNIGSAILFETLAACLPACDSMSGCAGVVFNPYYSLCQLKSSFAGTQTGNTSVIAAMRLVSTTTTSAPSGGSSQAISDDYGYGGAISDDPGYGIGPTSSSPATTSAIISVPSAYGASTSASVTSSGYIALATSSATATQSSSIVPSVSSQVSISTSIVVSSTWSSSQLSGTSAAASIISAPPCPSTVTDYCGQNNQQQTTCADNTGTIYFVACGLVYIGDIIDTSGIYGRELQLLSRATEPDVASCQRLCDRTTRCIAFNYIGTNCVLLSSVSNAIANANAIGGSVVQAAPTAVSTSSGASSAVSAASAASSQLSSASSSALSSSVLNSATFTQSSASFSAIVTLTTTVTTSVPQNGYYSTGSNGSFYVYPTSSPSGSASLCFTCGITPTIITGPTGPITQTTCSATVVGTTTIFTTSTITSCGPQPTCPASGYVIIGPSQAYPGQQVITTTDRSGGPITYTQIPTRTFSIASSPTSAATFQPTCPGSNGAVITDSMGVQYKIYCDTLFTDSVLDTQTQSTLGGCIASCDMYNVQTFYQGTQCFGLSWYEDLATDNCLLKGGATPVYTRGVDSCALLYPQAAPNNTLPSTGGYGSITYTTVVPPTTVISTYTTTAPASTITIYSTIYTNGQASITAIGYSTIPGTTIIGQTTNVIFGYTTVTERAAGPGYYSNGGNGGPGQTQTVTTTTTTASVLLVPTTIITTLSQGYTTTLVTYVPAPSNYYAGPGATLTQTVTTTSVYTSVAYVPTTITTTLSQGYTTTIVTSVPVTYTLGGGGGGSGGGGGAVTVSGGGGGGGGGATTVYITLTVTETVLPSSSSSSFTCRTYATNYLNGLHGRAEPTSAPMMRNGAILEPVLPAPQPMVRRRSIFEKEVILAEMAHVRSSDAGFGIWFVE